LNRVALDREQRFADIVVDFVPDLDINWPDFDRCQRESCLDPRTAPSAHGRARAAGSRLDSAITGGEGELYFRPIAGPD
jgi:hypothetical protein